MENETNTPQDAGEVDLKKKRNTALARRDNPTMLALETLQDMMQLAEWAAKSDLVPKDYRGKAENCLIAFQMGAEVGLHPLQALQSIAVINGRGAFYGDTVLAICRTSPYWSEAHFKEWTTGTWPNDDFTCHCQVGRKVADGKVNVVEESFSIEEAKRANLWMRRGRNGEPTPWVEYPKRMQKFKPRNWLLRDTFNDQLKGMPVVEDLQEVEEAEWQEVTDDDADTGEPKPTSRTEQMKERLAKQRERAAQRKADTGPQGAADGSAGDTSTEGENAPGGAPASTQTDGNDNGPSAIDQAVEEGKQQMHDEAQASIFDQVEDAGDDRREDMKTLGTVLKTCHLSDGNKFSRACAVILGEEYDRRSDLTHEQVLMMLLVLRALLEKTEGNGSMAKDVIWFCQAMGEPLYSQDDVDKAWKIYAEETTSG